MEPRSPLITSSNRSDLLKVYPQPERENFSCYCTYIRAWKEWRAWHRDHELNSDEAIARSNAYDDCVWKMLTDRANKQQKN